MNAAKVLLIAAVVCAAIATLIGFEVITDEHAAGWLAAAVGLVAGALAVDR